jgi:ABC-type multidrug transport system ATPase subunit
MARLAPPPIPAIDARDVTKTFRSGWLRRRATEALRGASLTVEHGTIFGLLGPNGAGSSRSTGACTVSRASC